MSKKTLALLLALILPLGAMSGSLAAEYYSARTPLYGASQAKQNNIDLVVEALDGIEIGYGETFSFNQTVGPCTGSRGYQSAPNGRGDRVTGGGVAQVATTLYLALQNLNGRIQYGPMQVYGFEFADGYVSDGNQALIIDYYSGIDFSFTNYADDLTIEMWASDSFLYCSLTVGYEPMNGRSGTGGSWSDDPDWYDGGSWNGGAAPGQPMSTLLSSASFYCGNDPKLIHNIELAAGCVDDTTLSRYDFFSFNDVVGPRTSEYGYQRAINGRGVKVTGGGVAQVASVIWLAVKNLDGIAIVEKATYGDKYNQSYVSSSSDAILTDYKAGRDFSFRYTGSGSITLYTWVEDNCLYCDVYANY